jgi:large subunit ribosomal protein L10
MPTEQKENAVEEMTTLLKDSKAVYFADFSGLDVPTFTALRRQLHEEDVTFTVVKNRLAKIAAANAGIEGLDDAFSGPTGMVCANEDPIAPARLMAKFAETADGKPKMKLGLMDGTIYVEEQVEVLAKLPSREVLLTQIVTGLQSPISGLAFCLSGILQSLVGTIQAVADQKKNEGGE